LQLLVLLLAVHSQRSKGLDDCKPSSDVIWVVGPQQLCLLFAVSTGAACACCYTCMYQAPGSLLLQGVFVRGTACACSGAALCSLRLAGLTAVLSQPLRISQLSIFMFVRVF
jgi:hypothetical protein